MSVFRCSECDTQWDSDYDGCVEDPKDNCELLCWDCWDGLYGDDECGCLSSDLIPCGCFDNECRAGYNKGPKPSLGFDFFIGPDK